MQFFEYKHLPRHLHDLASLYWALALWVRDNIVDTEVRTEALKKLIEAKDWALRARLYQPFTD
jgi:hypothetical protein